MRNIIRVFISDARRLATNVVAVVVIIGLAVIPSLYAWFNILSNWDPYGKDATGNLSIAVASVDEGTTLDGVALNVGDTVIDNLKQNDTINWVFTKSEADAIDGVKSGKYYAALVIDEKFSEDMVSFLGGDPIHPHLNYYENDKKNAIAPKITGKVKTTVQSEVNKAFVSTLTATLLEVGDYVAAGDQSSDIADDALEKLHNMDNDLTTAITILDSYISMINSAQSLSEATKAVTDEMDTILDSGRAMTNSADAATNAASASTEAVSDIITSSLNQTEYQIDLMENTMEETAAAIKTTGELTDAQMDSLKTLTVSLKNQFDTSISSVTSDPTVKGQVSAVDTDFDNLYKYLDTLQKSGKQTANDADDIYDTTKHDLDACKSDITELNNTYTDSVKPQLSSTMTSVQNSLTEVEQLLNYSSDGVEDVAAIMDSYPKMMGVGKANLISSKAEIVEMQGKLEKLIEDMESLDQNDQYQMLLTLIKTDPEIISDFISSPVNLDTEAIYKADNNGSAMSPFYIVLAIWVGALILVAILRTKVKQVPGVNKLRTYEEFFGRYIIFFIIGQLQTLITVMGCLLYVKIQCAHPFLLWLVCSLSSTTFTIFMYALVYAFEAVGEAIAVVLLVVQVAGTGGTFPVEVLPVIYQVLYKYMPFTYSMNAMRESILGMHGNDYWIYLSGLEAYIGISLVIGLLLSIPCKKLNKKIAKSKEATDLMA